MKASKGIYMITFLRLASWDRGEKSPASRFSQPSEAHFTRLKLFTTVRNHSAPVGPNWERSIINGSRRQVAFQERLFKEGVQLISLTGKGRRHTEVLKKLPIGDVQILKRVNDWVIQAPKRDQ